jgi:4-hydroxybenzoate polyprenyltransferase
MVRLTRSRRPSPPPADDPSTDTDPQVSAVAGGSTTTVATPDDEAPARRRGPVTTTAALVRSAHPRLALLTTAGVTLGAVATGREPREIGVVAATVLVGQAVLGWHNDLVDRARDTEHRVPGKPLADGRLEPGTVWFALACGVLLLVPLGVTSGIAAATAYLLAVLVGILGNVVLRTGALSWLTWAVSYALLPAFLSYGGWGGQFEGDPPRVAMTVLAAVLGIGVHVLVSLWGLEPDDAAGWRSLPLRLGRRLGSTRLLLLSLLWVAAALTAIVVVGSRGGLAQ